MPFLEFTPASAVTAGAAGFATCLALLASLGAQNLLLIRHGVQRHRTGLVVGIFLVSDIVLVLIGVAGVAGALAAAPRIREVATVAGAVFLFWLAFGAARRAQALRPAPTRVLKTPVTVGTGPTGGPPEPAAGGAGGQWRPGAPAPRSGLWVVAGSAVAVTWLNPQVLLETTFVLGAAGTSHGVHGQWWFVAGSVLASTVWFCGLGYTARALSGLLNRPGTWYALEVLTAVVMTLIGAGLLRSLW
ncbi:LysE/ArgO family amino acid transporter [Kocuria rosea]|uniref:LysE/ArgO family amino acid transporter n=1 Tax=Kocuria rosea TaxID=1275 RepID=UPI002B24AC27|nr:LysE family transporter [Kocuria rosea]MEB2528365.1 LysE family transporter [Kocuria rosea]MEB2617866.1 LysE family transporter [Kocuria rosea]